MLRFPVILLQSPKVFYIIFESLCYLKKKINKKNAFFKIVNNIAIQFYFLSKINEIVS